MNRRELIAGLGGLATARAFGLGADPFALPESTGTATPTAGPLVPGFPRKDDFTIEPGYTYLNAAYTHPIPKFSLDAARRAAQWRTELSAPFRQTTEAALSTAMSPKQLFARLINANESEIAYVSSTSEGENLVTRSLGLDHRFDGNVVTDGLHFEGSLMHLMELKKRGLDVRVAKPTADARIEFRDLERLVDKKTRLIEISAAAMYNGFQHDLKAVADLAHAHGALVYVDMIHSVGAEPFDVRASGIDFASCSSFKWLMGDFGLGFLYAKGSAMEKIERPVHGYYQCADIEPNYPPFLPPGPYEPVTYTLNKTATGMFETGSLKGEVEVNLALLRSSLGYVIQLGPENIRAHRLPMLKKLQEEMPRLGFTPVTPKNGTASVVTFAKRDLGKSNIPGRLADAKINVRIAPHWMRVSPSVYNDMADIERLLAALA
jgi:selenocysteine lyase/cysteine desulfurase